LSKRKSLLAVCLIAVLSLNVTTATKALPPGGTGFEDLYYSDSTFMDLVGWRYMECESVPSSWGVRTEWVERSQWDCQDPLTVTCRRYLCTETWNPSTGQWTTSCSDVGSCNMG
jgi:Family of unknown function (DUF6289)